MYAQNWLLNIPDLVQMPLNHVHLWLIDLADHRQNFDRLQHLLNDTETARAQRLLRPHVYERFVLARALLRQLLGHYLRCSPQEVHLQFSSYGKPSLDPSVHKMPLQFNISHSQDYVMVALTKQNELGVDIEYHKALNDFNGIIERVFSASEQTWLASLPEPSQQAAFFKVWTRKEALTKAMGLGLSLPFHEITVADGQAGDIPSEIRYPANHSTSWYIYDLPSIPQFSSALSLPKKVSHILCWQWKSLS